MEAVEERLAAQLAGGGGEEVVGELQALVAEHPLRERLRGQLMVALYRAGARRTPSRPCERGASSWWRSSESSPGRSCGGSSA